MHIRTIRIGLIWFCVLAVSATSCKKFLANYSQNNSFIETANDLDEILVGDAYFDIAQVGIPNMLHSMDDDSQLGTFKSSFNFQIATGFHYWQAQPFSYNDGALMSTDQLFNTLYNKIARINTILHNVPLMRTKGEPATTLDRLAGEAHFLRAYYYFMLVNVYGKPYQISTATTDFGVPLKTDPAIKGKFAERNTTQQVYDQILTDLLEAEKELDGANQKSTVRANQASVQALLSRVYLFMENYKMALQYADEVISSNQYQLINLNNHPAGADFLTRNSSEVIFTMGGNTVPGIMLLNQAVPTQPHFKPSNDLISSYLAEDLRLQTFFIENSQGQKKVAKKKSTVSPNADDVSAIFSVRLAEIYLNKAEALAGLNRFEEARTALQEFRKNRFKPIELPAIHLEGAVLMNTIRNERRLELCWETHRWFDLRRYAVNTQYPFTKTIRHHAVTFTGTEYVENGYYELGTYEQDAAAYIVPISNDEIEFNQGTLSNKPRPDRPLKQ